MTDNSILIRLVDLSVPSLTDKQRLRDSQRVQWEEVIDREVAQTIIQRVAVSTRCIAARMMSSLDTLPGTQDFSFLHSSSYVRSKSPGTVSNECRLVGTEQHDLR